MKFYVRGVEIKKGAFKNPSKFFFSQEREFFCRNRDHSSRQRSSRISGATIDVLRESLARDTGWTVRPTGSQPTTLVLLRQRVTRIDPQKKTRRPNVCAGPLVLSRPVADRRVVSWRRTNRRCRRLLGRSACSSGTASRDDARPRCCAPRPGCCTGRKRTPCRPRSTSTARARSRTR